MYENRELLLGLCGGVRPILYEAKSVGLFLPCALKKCGSMPIVSDVLSRHNLVWPPIFTTLLWVHYKIEFFSEDDSCRKEC